MDMVTTTIAFGLLLTTILVLLNSLFSRKKKLPPGPWPLPIIGNLHLLGYQPHKSISLLAKTYGPIMFLRLGYRNTLVISSAEMAKEVLQKQDLAFSNRAVYDATRGHNLYKSSLMLLPVGPQWRSLRKIVNSTVLARNRIDANQYLRRQKVQELIEYCRESSQNGSAVDLGQAAFRTSLNLMSNTIFSKDWEGPLSDSGKELKDLLTKITIEVIKPNVMDFFPFPKTFDPHGIRHRMSGYIARIFEILSTLIDERIEEKRGSEVKDENVIDILLAISKDGPEEINRLQIEALCFDLITAGTETTSVTVEWAMAEMLRNPEKIKKVKDEINQAIGKHKVLEEEDTNKLLFLQCVVKETLRLHPSSPFLIPREVEQDVHLCGYTIPKNSQVFVNAWAIGRDSDSWVDPLEFKPERFLDSGIDLRGADFELIPFGAGRRMCPAMSLGLRTVTLIVGSLLNSFDWKLEGEIHPEDLNMEERFGMTLQKAYPLRAIPIPW